MPAGIITIEIFGVLDVWCFHDGALIDLCAVDSIDVYWWLYEESGIRGRMVSMW